MKRPSYRRVLKEKGEARRQSGPHLIVAVVNHAHVLQLTLSRCLLKPMAP